MTPEIAKQFERLVSALSPENLYCDGEISNAEAAIKRKRLEAEWHALEEKIGRAVTEEEVWNNIIYNY